MPDVFVSYSRRDGEFVRRLVDALGERGKQAWVDVEGIRDAEVFPERLRSAIEESDGFVFVISPDAVTSEYCEQEVEHALELNKRIVPLLLRPVADSDVPEGVRVRNWIPFTDGDGEFEPGVARVVEALETDLEWTKAHTRWLVKALDWDSEGREKSFLLRGSELAAAEAWLAQEAGKEPEPTVLQREYVAASRVAASKRQRRLLGVAAGVVAVSLGLLVFALISRSQAIGSRNTARLQALTAKSQALAAESQTQLAVDPERSILLAMAAVRDTPAPEALVALRAALDDSPIRHRLPSVGLQTCSGFVVSSPALVYAPDGRQIAEAICGRVILLTDSNGRVVRRIRLGANAGSIAYSPDGRILAAATPRQVVLLDPTTGVVRKVLPHTASLAQLAFSPTQPLLALGGFGRLTLLDTRTGARRVIPFPRAVAHDAAVSLSFSRDGRRLAVSVESATVGPSGVGIVDIRSGRVVAKAGSNFVDAVAFAPDGKTVATAETPISTGGAIVVRSARTLKRIRTLLRLPAVETTAVAYSPDGSELAYGAADGTAGLLSARTGARLTPFLGHTAAVMAVRFSPDGRFVATASTDGTARVWSAAPLELRSITAPSSLQYLENVGNGFLAIVDRGPRRGLVVERLSAAGRPSRPLLLSKTDNVDAVFLSQDGRLAGLIPAFGPSGDAPVRIYDVASHRLVRTLPPSPAPYGPEPVFSPDDRLLALAKDVGGRTPVGPPGLGAGPKPGFVLVNGLTGAERVLGTTSCRTGWRGSAFSSHGGLVAAGSFCGQVEVWTVATGHRLGRPISIGGELAALAFDPAGQRLAIASWNSTITVADARTGRVEAVLTDHTRGVPDVTWSPDGRYLASASLDRTARVWDARTLRALRVLRHPDAVDSVRFTADSRRLVTTDADNTIRVWDACTNCENPQALLALASTRVTRTLTPEERRTFSVG